MKRNIFFIAIALASISQAHAVCFVDQKASGKDDGTSWANGFVDLDAALASASCTEVWVARGVYKPTGLSQMFSVKPTVALYGGFLGTESTLDQRDFLSNETILSGDVDNNDAHAASDQIDATTADIMGSNSPVVVLLDGSSGDSFPSTTLVDGFTITGASHSGGLACVGPGNCSPTLKNLVFSGNEGGGASFSGDDAASVSTPTLSNIAFRGNSNFGGGAIYAESYFGAGIALQIEDSTFEENAATHFGGAIYISTSSAGLSALSIERSRFSNNTAGGVGGGVFVNTGDSTAFNFRLLGTTFDGNSAKEGGAISLTASTTPLTTAIANATFANNSATLQGGAMQIDFHYASGGTNTLNNVTFSGNRANGDGMTPGVGGAIYLVNLPGTPGESLLVNNSIFWEDFADTPDDGPEIFMATVVGGATASIEHSVIDGGCPADVACSDVSSADPLLAPLGYHWGSTPVMRPGIGGSAIDFGDDATCEVTDQRGFTRPQGAHCDIGAVEFRLPSDDIIYADGF